MTSKNYKCDFNRDSEWISLGKYNLEPVRQVAIDDDFSALRFRIPQPERQKKDNTKRKVKPKKKRKHPVKYNFNIYSQNK